MTRRASTQRSLPWSGLDPDQRSTLFLYAGIGAIVLFALAIIAYGYYDQRIAPNHATVLKVGDRSFDYDYFKRRVTAAWLSNEITPNSAAQDAASILLDVEIEEVTRQAAARQGITFTSEEIDNKVRSELALPPEASRELFAARLRAELLSRDLSYDEYRELMVYELAEAKLREGFQAEIPTQVEHVNLGLIQTATREEAESALQRIQNGETFASVADDVSIQANKDPGGDMNWTPRGSLLKELEDAAFALEPGTRSGVLEISGGFFILDSRGKEVRDVSEQGKTEIVNGKLANLQTETREAVTSNINLTNGQLQKILESLPARATT